LLQVIQILLFTTVTIKPGNVGCAIKVPKFSVDKNKLSDKTTKWQFDSNSKINNAVLMWNATCKLCRVGMIVVKYVRKYEENIKILPSFNLGNYLVFPTFSWLKVKVGKSFWN